MHRRRIGLVAQACDVRTRREVTGRISLDRKLGRSIVIRMENNTTSRRHPASPLCGALLALACDRGGAEADAWQGIVELDERVLAFEIPGRLDAIAVDEGDQVDAGAELARLDDTLDRLERDARAAEARAVHADLALIAAGTRPEDVRSLQAALTAAKSSESLAKLTVGRERKLAAGGIGTAADLDAAESGIATATANRRDLEAKLARAKHGARPQEIDAAQARADAADTAVRSADERIRRRILRTDVAAVVLDVHVDPAEFAQTGAPIVTLGDVHHPYVDVFVPQARIGEVALGAAVDVRVDARAQALPGTVEYIARQSEFTPKFLFSERERPNLVVRVRVRIDAPHGDLPAGVPAFVTLAQEAS
ncbi:MAG: HlyD family efflux transporter periplasmic adaptor subunit [Deltaproteobacteria bacterium]|nr:HlyD family efflux transporter periplasmic adaptor subunit [Nannocystaceae bacterium]